MSVRHPQIQTMSISRSIVLSYEDGGTYGAADDNSTNESSDNYAN